MTRMARILIPLALRVAAFVIVAASVASAQAPLTGTVRDETGAALPGVLVEVRSGTAAVGQTQTNERGEYRLDGIGSGRFELSFTLVNFATVRRPVTIGTDAQAVDAVLFLVLSADVTVTGKSTFTNLADAPDPAQDLVGIAQSASQGAVTARQLETRPIMRPGEVLETVPGVVISQHSGEGKANQYYLRGFNLDHGTDFATTVAGMPVNMPTHGHGHGYSDLNFLIPELVERRAVLEGPVLRRARRLRDRGHRQHQLHEHARRVRSCASAAATTRSAACWSPRRRLSAGHAPRRARTRAQRRPVGTTGRLCASSTALIRYTRGDARNGLSVDADGLSRDVELDRSDPGARGGRRTHRSIWPRRSDRWRRRRRATAPSLEWQRSDGNASTTLSAYGLEYDLDLFSNFTYFLDDPENGDQFQQTDHRFVSGARLTHRRIGRWMDRPTAEYRRRPVPERQHRRHRPLSHARARAARHHPPGLGDADQYRRLRAERDRVDAVAADDSPACASTVIASTSTPASPRTAAPTTRDSSARKAARSLDRSQRPRSTSTPASASTATTRAARPSPSIR